MYIDSYVNIYFIDHCSCFRRKGANTEDSDQSLPVCTDFIFKVQKTKSQTRFNPIVLRKAEIVYNIGLYECNRVKRSLYQLVNCLLTPSFLGS